ncbi:response regulator transcription factor [Rarobacter faecitabidus]|uniref:LuxR family two component transcriptional regulator n=1 Tax=Rarobacter faecitabidus TaxID=13243 RepID=A0A542ZT86_RARFA|nr:response regulator transcription factor [Rarobacter faecitabidus]TQL63565.1 LuxR family two component transcriptional regulator [Rarobacter faecitabidus]
MADHSSPSQVGPEASVRPQLPPVRVAIVEDNTLFRQMLATSLSSEPRMHLVTQCASVAEARSAIKPGMVDVVIMDISLIDGNGVALGISLQRNDAHLKVLLLSAHNAMDLLLDLPDAVKSRWSYLSKNSSVSVKTLTATIERTAAGRQVLDPNLLAKAQPRAGTSVSKLSARRYEVLRLLAQGLSNSGIAQALGIADKSVQNHINAIYACLDIDADPSANPRVLATLRMLEESGSLID